VRACIEDNATNASLAEFIGPLAEHTKRWADNTLALGRKAASEPEQIGAASYDYLAYSGYIVLAFWWAKSVAIADAGAYSADFKTAKRETARFYFQRLLPRAYTHMAAIESGTAPLMGLHADLFDS
jgi:hypothetical protein